jgi:tRNA (mo5U34)-methyltransferase
MGDVDPRPESTLPDFGRRRLLRRGACGLDNTRTAGHNIYEVKPSELGHFDIIMCYGLLYHVGHPVGLLRLCRDLVNPTGGVCVIETQVVPNTSGMVDWGSYEDVRPLQGTFGIIDETDEFHAPEASTTGICLCPSLEALLWIMGKLGFTNVVQIAPRRVPTNSTGFN